MRYIRTIHGLYKVAELRVPSGRPQRPAAAASCEVPSILLVGAKDMDLTHRLY